MRPALLAVMLATAFALPGSGQGQAASDLRDQRSAREADGDRYRSDAADLRADVDRLRRELVRLGAAQAAGERDVGGRRSRLELLNARETELRARTAAAHTRQARLLGALQLYSRNPPPALFVSPGSAKNAVRAAILMRSVAPELERRATAFSAEVAAITRARRQAAAASEALFTAESSVADRRGDIERLIADKRALERSLLLDADAAEAEARALAARASSLGDLIGDVSRAAPDRPAALRTPRRLVPPVEGELVRRYGDPVPGGRARGSAWRTARRAQVRSPADARVQFAGWLKGYGVVVILRTGGAYDLVLAGLDSAAPPPGGQVAAGEPIGRMAAGGARPELYLEVRKNGAPVNPSGLLPLPPASPTAPVANIGLRGAIKPS